MPDLTDFQLEVTRLFFSLPASKGFLLAGGAALLAQHLTTRPTEDLDFFTAPDRGHVPAARDALEAAARKRGWATERIHDSDTFCRLVIRSDTAEVVTDLAVDTPPDFPASSTAAGPTLAPEELAGRKLLALFDRAAARDFADVRLLARRFGGYRRYRDARADTRRDCSPATSITYRIGPTVRRAICRSRDWSRDDASSLHGGGNGHWRPGQRPRAHE